MKKTEGKKQHFPNGYMTDEEWIQLITDEEAFDKYQREFSLAKGKDKCPPVDLTEDGICYHCTECHLGCAKMVKVFKRHYMVRNIKYLKEDLDA